MGPFGQADQPEALETVLGGDGDSDDVGFVPADLGLDRLPVQAEDVGRNDFDGDAFLLQNGADRQ